MWRPLFSAVARRASGGLSGLRTGGAEDSGTHT